MPTGDRLLTVASHPPAGSPHRRLSHRLVLRAGVVWLALMTVETVHGIARTLLLVPYLGEFPSRQVGVLSGSVLILLTATGCSRWLRAETRRVQLLVGGLWVLLTVLFELGLGRYVFGYSSARLLADYDLVHGGLMPLGLVVLALAPMVGARLAGGRQSTRVRGDGADARTARTSP